MPKKTKNIELIEAVREGGTWGFCTFVRKTMECKCGVSPRQRVGAGRGTAVRYLQLHPGAPQYHLVGSHRKRKDPSGLRFGYGCGETVLCGKIHPVPGSAGGISDRHRLIGNRGIPVQAKFHDLLLPV